MEPMVRVKALRAIGVRGVRHAIGTEADIPKSEAESFGEKYVRVLGPGTGEPPMDLAALAAAAKERKAVKETPKDKQAAPPAEDPPAEDPPDPTTEKAAETPANKQARPTKTK